MKHTVKKTLDIEREYKEAKTAYLAIEVMLIIFVIGSCFAYFVSIIFFPEATHTINDETVFVHEQMLKLVFSSTVVYLFIKFFFNAALGPIPIPYSFTISEAIRIVLKDLLVKLDNYSEHDELKFKKKARKEIKKLCQTLDTHLKRGEIKIYNIPSNDLFTENTWLFKEKMNLITAELIKRTSNLEEIPSKYLSHNLSKIKELFDSTRYPMYEDVINPVNIIFTILEIKETSENDNKSLTKRSWPLSIKKSIFIITSMFLFTLFTLYLMTYHGLGIDAAFGTGGAFFIGMIVASHTLIK